MPVPLFLIWFAQVVFSSHQAKEQQQAQPEVWAGDGFEREALIPLTCRMYNNAAQPSASRAVFWGINR
jgi:hypothetical protein